MQWIQVLEHSVVQLSSHVPLPSFVILGEIVEEIVSPIPSQAVLITAGSIAQAQHWSLLGLFFLAIIAAFAKTMATLIYYFAASKLEDRLVPMFGKYIGITHEDIVSLGKKLDKGGSREFLSLLALRCLPVVPSVPISVICGLLKINIRTFVLSALAGNLIRGSIVLLTGYLGFDVLEAFANGVLTWQTIGVLLVLLVLVSFIAWGYYKRYQKK